MAGAILNQVLPLSAAERRRKKLSESATNEKRRCRGNHAQDYSEATPPQTIRLQENVPDHESPHEIQQPNQRRQENPIADRHS
jgi:hypothetical protein